MSKATTKSPPNTGDIPPIPKSYDLLIEQLGEPKIPSPLLKEAGVHFTDEKEGVLLHSDTHLLEDHLKKHDAIPRFERAGARKKIFFNPADTACGIVTCGGLCPGLNDVIRSIVLTLTFRYKVKKILGFYYGYSGITSKPRFPAVTLTPDRVKRIHEMGGTILGSSRGHQDPADMVQTLIKNKIRILFVIGGDGTLKGAHAIANEAKKRKAALSVIGIPKTIDNDIMWVTRSFGFQTAVDEARRAIAAAHIEAHGAWNGIGLVKVMGRHSGFIAAHSTLANYDVNYCLVPEIPFSLEGSNGFLKVLEDRLRKRHHAVVVVAEGAGQDLIKQEGETEKDSSGNIKLKDVGLFLKEKIIDYFQKRKLLIHLRYIDPSYTIRSLPANGLDSLFCSALGQNAVHAGMAGKTNMAIGLWNNRMTHAPFKVMTAGRNKLDPRGEAWQRVLEATGQPMFATP